MKTTTATPQLVPSASGSIRTGIDEGFRHQLSEDLARLLADTYTLYLKTHNFHWNVTGPMFQPLHGEFQAQYQSLWEATDVLAERIRSLGYFAPGSYREFADLTQIPESIGHPTAQEMIRQLLDGHSIVVQTARRVLQVADDARDDVTLDLVTQRLAEHEKTMWMLRSFIEE